MSALRCRSLAMLMLVVFLAGCTTWRPTTVSPRVLIEEEQPSSIRVTRTDGTSQVLNSPIIVNDSIAVVEEQGCEVSDAGGGRFNCVETEPRVLMPLDEVRAVEVRRSSSAGRGFLIGAGVGLAVSLVATEFGSHQGLCQGSGDYGTFCAIIIVGSTVATGLLGALVGGASGP